MSSFALLAYFDNKLLKAGKELALTLSEHMAVLNLASPLVLEFRLHGAFFGYIFLKTLAEYNG